MRERSTLISKLLSDSKFRADYLRAKVGVNVSSQVKALRLRQEKTQIQLAGESGLKQSRISAIERPGAHSPNLDTLIRLAAAFKVGLLVRFVPFSEVRRRDDAYSQDDFDVVTIDKDVEFLRPAETAFPPAADAEDTVTRSKMTPPDREITIVAGSGSAPSSRDVALNRVEGVSGIASIEAADFIATTQ